MVLDAIKGIEINHGMLIMNYLNRDLLNKIVKIVLLLQMCSKYYKIMKIK